MFLPITLEEIERLKWDTIDIVFVTGDAYIDSYYNGVALLGKLLLKNGYKVAVISQPDLESDEIKKFGEPNLFWGVTGGSIDSMVANYTALLKKRRSDDLTPGGINNKRPDRAVIKYVNLIRQNFKNTKPIVIGGIEASLRRIVHYDYWSDSIKRSILFDAKADYLIYKMAELSILQFAYNLKNNLLLNDIRGLCYISRERRGDYLELPSYEEIAEDKLELIRSYLMLYENSDPVNAKGLTQKHNDRYLIHNPPSRHLTKNELDETYEMDFENKAHPFYKEKITAVDTIKNSITTHRGCYGECNFCAIAVHQGTTVISRSVDSVIKEAKSRSIAKDFNGIISDLGGPTANMYGFECSKKLKYGKCLDKKCIADGVCNSLKVTHKQQILLFKKIREIENIKKVFVASGIRIDLIYNDRWTGYNYLDELVKHHTSGQLKIAPEHTEDNILRLMGKPSQKELLLKFSNDFFTISKKANKNQFLTYYMIAAHPGCDVDKMKKARDFMKGKLKSNPQQVQIFTPLPLTISSLMYFLEIDPFSNKKIFVEKKLRNKNLQKEMLLKSKTDAYSIKKKGSPKK